MTVDENGAWFVLHIKREAAATMVRLDLEQLQGMQAIMSDGQRGYASAYAQLAALQSAPKAAGKEGLVAKAPQVAPQKREPSKREPGKADPVEIRDVQPELTEVISLARSFCLMHAIPNCK